MLTPRFALLACIVGTALLCQTASAQAPTNPSTTTVALPALPAPPQPKRFRFYFEDFIAVGFTADLNPRDRFIVYPGLGLDYIFPELSVNVRTAGAHYAALGIAQNVLVAQPIVRFSYGQQWRYSFVEVGLIGVIKREIGGSTWTESSIFPRLAVGVRF